LYSLPLCMERVDQPAKLEEKTLSPARRWWRRTSIKIWGHDVFISYIHRRVDREGGDDYARALRDALDRTHACFWDVSAQPPSTEVSAFVKEARRSRLFVLIGTKGITESDAVKKEVGAYWSARARWPWCYFRKIFPIDVNGALDSFKEPGSVASHKGTDWEPLAGLVQAREDPLAFASNRPSVSILNEIRQQHGVLTSNMRSIAVALTILLVAASFSGWAAYEYNLLTGRNNLLAGQIGNLEGKKNELELQNAGLAQAIQREQFSRVRAEVGELAGRAENAGEDKKNHPSQSTLSWQQSSALNAIQRGLSTGLPDLDKAIEELRKAFAFDKPVLQKRFELTEEREMSDISRDLSYVAATNGYSLDRFFLGDRFSWDDPHPDYFKDKCSGIQGGIKDVRHVDPFLVLSAAQSAVLISLGNGHCASPDLVVPDAVAADLQPNGGLVASIDSANRVRLSQQAAGGAVSIATYSLPFACGPGLPGHKAASIRFSSDGMRLGVLCEGSLLALRWDRQERRLKLVVDQIKGVDLFALHPRENTLAVFIEHRVVLRSPPNFQKKIWEDRPLAVRGKSRFRHLHELAFSPDGSVLAAIGGVDGEGSLVDISDKEIPPPEPSHIWFYSTSDPAEQFEATTVDGAIKVRFGNNDSRHLAAFGPAGISLHYVPAISDWALVYKLREYKGSETSVISRLAKFAERSQWTAP
jgi:hypothetical protein